MSDPNITPYNRLTDAKASLVRDFIAKVHKEQNLPDEAIARLATDELKFNVTTANISGQRGVLGLPSSRQRVLEARRLSADVIPPVVVTPEERAEKVAHDLAELRSEFIRLSAILGYPTILKQA